MAEEKSVQAEAAEHAREHLALAYESPTPEERLTMRAPEDRQGRIQALGQKYADRQRAQRNEEITRTTALSLAVQWTATSAEQVEEIGSVFGIADLMIEYIRTGRKPTRTQAERAQKPFRR